MRWQGRQRAQERKNLIGALDALRSTVDDTQTEKKGIGRGRRPQQIQARPSPHTVETQTGQSLQTREPRVESDDVSAFDVQAEPRRNTAPQDLPESREDRKILLRLEDGRLVDLDPDGS